jgi:hypothetical protein
MMCGVAVVSWRRNEEKRGVRRVNEEEGQEKETHVEMKR